HAQPHAGGVCALSRQLVGAARLRQCRSVGGDPGVSRRARRAAGRALSGAAARDVLMTWFHYILLSETGRDRGPVMLANSTASIPVIKMPSNVPAPPIEATGAPSPLIRPRLSRSAPISVPRLPLM